jgi:hypothetical protein
MIPEKDELRTDDLIWRQIEYNLCGCAAARIRDLVWEHVWSDTWGQVLNEIMFRASVCANTRHNERQ